MSDSVPAPRPVIDGGTAPTYCASKLEPPGSSASPAVIAMHALRRPAAVRLVSLATTYLVPALLRQATSALAIVPVSRYAVAIQLPCCAGMSDEGRSRRRWTRSGRPVVIS